MFVDDSSQQTWKRRRLPISNPMEACSSAQAKIAEMREKLGREIRVFETSTISQRLSQAPQEESDEFYELTAADYYCLVATKKEDKSLKTRKLREAEEAARRSKLTKVFITLTPSSLSRYITLEATFHPSEKIQCLIDLLRRVVAHPDISFYLYTTPPKKQVKDSSQDFYSAGFVPGAIVYFANDQPKDDGATSSPYLNEEILSLKDLEVTAKAEEPVEPSSEPATDDSGPVPVEYEHTSTEKKSTKPKWFKM